MRKRSLTIRLGPLGLSLAAAALTAIGFAAVSLADSGGGSSSGGRDTQTFTAPGPPGGGARVMFRDKLSEADRQKLEDFRRCMEDNGAPAPPEPGEIDPSRKPPAPPSKADQEKIQKAWEACKDELPEEMQDAGPPQVHAFGCGPPPGAPGAAGTERGSKQNR
jgi:hypothetical protein